MTAALRWLRVASLIAFSWLSGHSAALGQTGTGAIRGKAIDETGAALPGVTVEARMLSGGRAAAAVTNTSGEYALERLSPGRYQLSFTLINFGSVIRRDVDVGTTAPAIVNAVMHLALNAEVTVSAKRTFANLADFENPAENLVGIAESASQGAITSRQLEVRPIMRQGEVLETIPGVMITQHSGEGKANQYFLRGFNLDHGTDFAQTIAGIPVNMPTHAHSHGYSDVNFLIPELVAGVQYSKGPYFADQGDFATAGASNINYATSLDAPMVNLQIGTFSYSRGLFAASPRIGPGHLLVAFEASNNSGPWTIPDSYKKLNGVLRYSQGDKVNGFTLTAMGYHATWHATEASPARAVAEGLIGRFDSIDPSDGGDTDRYSAAFELQRSHGSSLTKVTAYGLLYHLDLISNFTFFLDDPVHGDQQEQVDRRFTSGFKLFHRRQSKWYGRNVQNTVGVGLRNDDIRDVALYHTEQQQRLETKSKDSAMVTSAGVYASNELEWSEKFRTMLGVRADGLRNQVDALLPVNSGRSTARMISPKGSATLGPWKSTEFYVNAGTGFHSNDARGTTITVDSNGAAVDRVTPMVRAKGAEIGVRTVAIPHLQSTVSLWTLSLASELVYNGDVGATEPGPASIRHGIEIANYYSPKKWLVFDADVSLSRARFTEHDPAGDYVPEAVNTVVSAGASMENFRRVSASARLRYFGPRALVQDNSIQSEPTSLVNLECAYQLGRHIKVSVEVFNLFNRNVDDITYYFTSRLPGEPLEGIEDIHFHPAVPRAARAGLVFGF